jgi:hypothetical protein
MMLHWPPKGPDEKKDYGLDWTKFLEGDKIASVVWVVDTGITVEMELHDDFTVTIWLSGGTAGTEYTVLCKIETVAGRDAEQSVKIKVLTK